jgi:hypothetical protein
MAKLTQKQQRLARVREEIEKGRELSQISDVLEMKPEKVDAAIRELFEGICSRMRDMSREHMFAELLLVGTGHMRKLNDLAASEKTRAGDAVAAIKGSWAIRRGLLSEARDMGMVARNADTVEGIDISKLADMSIDEIRHALLSLPDRVKKFEAEYKQAGIMDLKAGSMFGAPTGELTN